MEQMVQFITQSWGVLPLELLIILGLLCAIVLMTRYFLKQLDRKDDKIDEMTGVLMETSKVLSKVVDNIELVKQEQERMLGVNKDLFLAEIKLQAANIQSHITSVFMSKDRGRYESN